MAKQEIETTYTGDNFWGRQRHPSMFTAISGRRIRKANYANANFIHRTKNGVYDPFSYYHVVDVLMQMKPDSDFTARQMTDYLNDHKRQLRWDATTVGRILVDIADNLHEVYGHYPMDYARRWNGVFYHMPDYLEGRLAFYRLIEDLHQQCEALLEAEHAGDPAKRVASPLEFCPSLRL